MTASRNCWICIPFKICVRAFCFAVLLSKDITIELNKGFVLFICDYIGFSLSYKPNREAPRGSFVTRNTTGSCLETVCMSCRTQATEWELPQATLLIATPSKPCTRAGRRFTVVDPLPCWPWSLSPHAYTCPISVTAKQCKAPTATWTTFLSLRASMTVGFRMCRSEPWPKRK